MFSDFSPGLWERKMLPCPFFDLYLFPLSGQFCETPPRPPAPRSPCEGTECQNGANCVDQGSGPVCQCLPGFGGPECEKLLSVNFVDRDTYLQFTDLQNWPRANITLQVRAQGASHRGESGSRGPWPQVRASSSILAQNWEQPVSVKTLGMWVRHIWKCYQVTEAVSRQGQKWSPG